VLQWISSAQLRSSRCSCSSDDADDQHAVPSRRLRCSSPSSPVGLEWSIMAVCFLTFFPIFSFYPFFVFALSLFGVFGSFRVAVLGSRSFSRSFFQVNGFFLLSQLSYGYIRTISFSSWTHGRNREKRREEESSVAAFPNEAPS